MEYALVFREEVSGQFQHKSFKFYEACGGFSNVEFPLGYGVAVIRIGIPHPFYATWIFSPEGVVALLAGISSME